MTRNDVVETLERLVANYSDLKVKGKKTAYTAMNGNMFSFVDASGLLCFRLSRDDKSAFESEHETTDVIQYGLVMRGYVPVPNAMLDDSKALQMWFGKCVENARNLKSKPTKKG